jgi:hypothetical protein
MQLRNVLLIMILAYTILFFVDFSLTASLLSHPEMEENPIARYFLERGSLPVNLGIPYLVILILFAYGYDRFYYNPEMYLWHTIEWLRLNPCEIRKYKIYYFNMWKMFIPMYILMLVFITSHIRGIVSYL